MREIRCTKAALRVFGVWIWALWAVPAAFAAWQAWWAGPLVWLAGGALSCVQMRRVLTAHLLHAGNGELRLERGRTFRTVLRQPVSRIAGVVLVTSPLLRRGHSCIAVLRSAGGVWVMAGISLDDGQYLALLPGSGGSWR